MTDTRRSNDEESDNSQLRAGKGVASAHLFAWVSMVGGLLVAVAATASTYVAVATYNDDSRKGEESKQREIEEYGQRVATYWAPDAGSFERSGVTLENRNSETLHDARATFAVAGAIVMGAKAWVEPPSVSVSLGAIHPCSRTTLLASKVMETPEFTSYMKRTHPGVSLRDVKWNTAASFSDGEGRAWRNQEEGPFDLGETSGSTDIHLSAADLKERGGFLQGKAEVCK